MSDLNFPDASNKAKTGDTLLLEIEKTERVPGFRTEIIKGREAEKGEFTLSWGHYYAHGWQIIPARKEMVSAEEIVDGINSQYVKIDRSDLLTYQTAVEIATRSAKNRDILYDGLMEALSKVTITNDQVNAEFDRISDVLGSTSSTDSET